MQNMLEQDGDIVEVTAPAPVVSGQAVLVGKLFGVAISAAAAGARVAIRRRGVFNLPKAGATVFTEGALAYWNSGAGQVTTASAGNTKIGAATAAAGNGPVLVPIALDGTASPTSA
jgi:predicted RecA/RadA family phage recombinase